MAFAYFLGLLISIAGIFAGNVLGWIITSIWGWKNLAYEMPAGSALAAIQGAAGAYVCLLASHHWLDSARYSDFWLRGFVWLASGLFIVIGILAVLAGRSDQLLAWKTLATFANIGALELTRRATKDDL